MAVAVPLTSPVSGDSIMRAQAHLDFVPARLRSPCSATARVHDRRSPWRLTIRRRPLGNGLVIAGVVVAAAGSGLAGLGIAETAGFIAAAAVLLYAGFLRTGGRRAV